MGRGVKQKRKEGEKKREREGEKEREMGYLERW